MSAPGGPPPKAHLHKRFSPDLPYASCGRSGPNPAFADQDDQVTCWDCKEDMARTARNARKQGAILAALADLSKVPDLTTIAPEGLEAPCPVCHRYNAMLAERWLAHLGHQRNLMMCRDCGYIALSPVR
jgi:hypothetical protein